MSNTDNLDRVLDVMILMVIAAAWGWAIAVVDDIPPALQKEEPASPILYQCKPVSDTWCGRSDHKEREV
jgi:hypothetical protein